MTVLSYGKWGEQRHDDGSSRQFVPDTTDPRLIVAEVLARRDGWAEIRPGHWAQAGRVVKALRAAGQLVDRRRSIVARGVQ